MQSGFCGGCRSYVLKRAEGRSGRPPAHHHTLRAIVIGGDDLMPKQSADEQAVAAMLNTATAARSDWPPIHNEARDEKVAPTLTLLSRPAMLIKGGRVHEDPETGRRFSRTRN